jgi:hypothetical protein
VSLELKTIISFAMCPIDVSSANNLPKPVIPSAMSFINTKNNNGNFDFEGASLRDVELHKHLGVIFSNDCKWTKHIDKLIEKSSKQINVLRKLKFKLKRNYLEKIMSCKESLSFAMCPIDVSSANNLSKPVIPSAMSFINTKNNNGPKTDP